METQPAKTSSSAMDFVSTNPDKLDVCSGSAPGGSGFDAIIRAIGAAIGDNVTCLSIATGVVIASLAVVWYAAAAMYKSVSEWRMHQLPGKPTQQQASASGGANNERDDDVTYALSPGSDGIPSDLGPQPTAPIVAARMAKLAQRYSSYNAAMRQRASEKGVVADDIMDASILSRANDDWSYSRRGVGARGGGGGTSSRPWALRSPVYNTNPA